MKSLKLMGLLLSSALLFGCASGAKMESMIATEQGGLTYSNALKKEISVEKVSGGESTNPLWTSEISNGAFSGALKKSLENEGLLSDTGRYQLQATLLQVEQPLFGLDLKVVTHVEYLLIDKDTNKVVLQETVIAPHTATMDDAFVAIQRLRIANEGSGRKNIEGLLVRLSALNIPVGAVELAK